MIALYPKIWKRFILYSVIVLIGMIVLTAVYPGISIGACVLMCLIGIFALLLSASSQALALHKTELARLYNQLDAEGFIKAYSVHLSQKLPIQDTGLMVRMHLSNAYAALGRFDEAIELLQSFKLKEGKKKENYLISQFARMSNLCYCAEQKEDIEKAEEYLHSLLDLKKELEALQAAKKPQKRMVFSTELNEQCLSLLKSGKADVEALKRYVQTNTHEMLPRITTSLWIARAYLADNQRREAEKLLNRIVELAPELYPGKEAKRFLEELVA